MAASPLSTTMHSASSYSVSELESLFGASELTCQVWAVFDIFFIIASTQLYVRQLSTIFPKRLIRQQQQSCLCSNLCDARVLLQSRRRVILCPSRRQAGRKRFFDGRGGRVCLCCEPSRLLYAGTLHVSGCIAVWSPYGRCFEVVQEGSGEDELNGLENSWGFQPAGSIMDSRASVHEKDRSGCRD